VGEFYMHQTALERLSHDQWRAGLRLLGEFERAAHAEGDTALESICDVAANWLRADRSRTAASHFRLAWGALSRALGGSL
jgi:hypothetical protein